MALFLLLFSKDKELGRKFLYQNPDGSQYFSGDLFESSGVTQFREKIIKFEEDKTSPLVSSNILMQGDSFMLTDYDSKPLPNVLKNVTGKNIFFYKNEDKEITPLTYLKDIGYRAGAPKIFIYETIERHSDTRALALTSDFSDKAEAPVDQKIVTLRKAIGHFIFDEVDVEYFIRNNFIFRPVILWLKNEAFLWFGSLDEKTPVYLDKPKMLFNVSEVYFYNDKSKFKSIDKMADNISQEAKLLKDKYNLTLVYLVIPTKISIYGGLLDNFKKYDDFIPILQTALAKRDVIYVDVYDVFKNYSQKKPESKLYYAGDSHYNSLGKNLLVETLINSNIGLK